MTTDYPASPLDGKVVIITGAASGMGRAAALLCAARGAAVVAADLNADGADAVAAEIESAGGTALAQAADLTAEDDVNRLVEAAVRRSPASVPSTRCDEGNFTDTQRGLFEAALDDVCMTELARPQDIAPVVAFLASDDARYVQAATIDVNGGLLAHMPGAAGRPASAHARNSGLRAGLPSWHGPASS